MLLLAINSTIYDFELFFFSFQSRNKYGSSNYTMMGKKKALNLHILNKNKLKQNKMSISIDKIDIKSHKFKN
jgi:hypothetical protein